MKQGTLLDHDPQARRPFDYYATPDYQIRALLKYEVFSGMMLEPCCGDGAIVRGLQRAGYDVMTNDLDPQWPANYHADITRPESWATFGPFRNVVTNLPFNVADQIVPLALQHTTGILAVILRLSWLEPTGEAGDESSRGKFLKRHPPNRLIVLPRHDYKGNGQGDSVTTAWFIWRGWPSSANGITVVSKAERDELIARGRL